MFRSDLCPHYTLGILIVILVIITAGAGLFVGEDLYAPFMEDALLVGLPVQDSVSLLVALFLAAAMAFTRRGSARAFVIWGGLLVYTLYYYAFYCFGYVYTIFYPLYLAILGLSTYSLAGLLVNVDGEAFSRQIRNGMPVRFLALVLGMPLLFVPIWLSRLVQGIQTQQARQADLVFVLDLAFLIPAMTLAAVQIWRRRPAGYLLGGVLLVKAPLSGILLTGGSLRQLLQGIRVAPEELAIYIFLAVAGLLAVGLYLRNLYDKALTDPAARPSA